MLKYQSVARKASPKMTAAARPMRFVNFFQQGSVAPSTDEHLVRSQPWVRFGHDNLFPERCVSLADNCMPLYRSAQKLALFLAGTGVEFVDEGGEPIEQAQVRFQEWMADGTEEEFLFNTFLDYALLGGLSLKVRRSASQIVRLDHLDVSRLRSARMTDMQVRSFYWSPRWAEYRKSEYTPKELPNYMTDPRQAMSVVYACSYKQNRDYYGEPMWLPAFAAAEVWAKIDPYNRTQIDTGFAPTVHIHVPANMDEADIDQLVEDTAKTYQGATGNGVFVTTGSPTVEGDKVEVNVIGNTTNAGQLDELRDAAAGVIYDAFGIPRILITEQETGLASQGLAVRQSLEAFQRTEVIPRQKVLTRVLTRLMNDAGISVWDTRIRPLDVFAEEMDEVLLRQSYIRTVTVDEHREKVLGYDPIGGEDGSKLIIASGAEQGGEPA